MVDGHVGLRRLPRVDVRTRRIEVADALRRAILAGALPPGTRLGEVRVAAELGVSRPTVREATRQLVDEGFLIEEPYKGVHVARVANEALLDISAVRVVLETLAGQRIAERLNSELDTHLGEALEQLDRALKTKDAALAHEAHLRFHGSLFELSGIEMLRPIWLVISNHTALAMSVAEGPRPDYAWMRASHHHLVDVLRARDPKAIAAAVSAHISEVMERTLQGEINPGQLAN